MLNNLYFLVIINSTKKKYEVSLKKKTKETKLTHNWEAIVVD